MGALSPTHWAIVAVVLVVLFGSKKLPDAARGLGRSMRILKSEVGELHSDPDLAWEKRDGPRGRLRRPPTPHPRTGVLDQTFGTSYRWW
ncbi:Sec-independent protein translocase subunit TatA [Rhodococcus sp. (in: high G+C Gram-positive bacteria)]|uniref:Sec-independent protein translocase subunit TatA n=1 Tax=Rhodococcus sp. TaxID=1831 RepID=UPI0033156610